MSDEAAAPSPHFPLTFESGERGRALGYRNGVLHVACEHSHPPGQPLAVTVQLDGAELRLAGKSAGTKRRPDGGFDVQLRLHSVRREQRDALERAFAARS
jgi:hypothetical protein